MPIDLSKPAMPPRPDAPGPHSAPSDVYASIAAIAAARATTARDRRRNAVPETIAQRNARNARIAAATVASIAFRSTIAERNDYPTSAPFVPNNFTTKR